MIDCKLSISVQFSFPGAGDNEIAKFYAIQAAAEGADAVFLDVSNASAAEISAIEDALSVPLLVRFAEISSIASESSTKFDSLAGGYVIPLEQVSPRYCLPQSGFPTNVALLFFFLSLRALPNSYFMIIHDPISI